MKILSIIIISGLLLFSSALFAHTGMQSTIPTNNAVLQEAPKTLSLTFKAAVRLMKVGLRDNKLEPVILDFKPTAQPAKSFFIDLPKLTTVGTYNASWMVMGKDGHKMKGNFIFTVDSLSAGFKEDKTHLPLVTVYKSASCGCCAAWIEHMKENGFPVEAHNAEDLNQYKIKAKLGPSLGSCHTAFVGDYAIEGHVPANDVKRLLTEKPSISGLAAPGMPMNSPGMAPEGSKPSGYDVVSFKDGETVGVFSKY